MMRTSDHRKHIPVRVKLHATLLLLGFTDEEINGGLQWDHQPALALRVVDAKTGELRPHPNDPRHLRPLRRADHAAKTFGPGGERRITTAGGDAHAIAHTRRSALKEAEFRARLLAKADGKVAPPTKHRKRPIQSRGFSSQHRSFQSSKSKEPDHG